MMPDVTYAVVSFVLMLVKLVFDIPSSMPDESPALNGQIHLAQRHDLGRAAGVRLRKVRRLDEAVSVHA